MAAVDHRQPSPTPVGSLADLSGWARAEMADLLERSRAAPLPAVPDGHAEPGDDLRALADCPVLESTCPALDSPVGDAPAHRLGVLDLLDRFARGTHTPSAVLAALHRRWAEDPHADEAILAAVPGAEAAAADADRRWRTGTARVLEGIPFAVKDVIDVAGAPVTAGTTLTGERVAARDATAVARLRAAGAIPVAITATTEFACGAPHNRRYGAVTNPWDRDRWTGGSSTGSAAALAAGLVPLALGTDTGGSIRVPSALCNLTGVKPTYGAVPRTGLATLSWTLDHIGPMARSAADLRPVLAVLAAEPTSADAAADPRRRVCEQLTVPARSGARIPLPLRGLRIGVPRTWFTDLCDASVLAVWRETLATLRVLGARTVDLDIPDVAANTAAHTIVLTSEFAGNQEAATARFAELDLGTQLRMARGTAPTAVDYLRAVRRRGQAVREVVAAFDDAGADVLVTPTVGAVAPRLADTCLMVDGVAHPFQSLIARYTAIFDYLGLPAVALPAGFVDDLPVGVQVCGRPWSDDLCLRIATVVQAATDHHRRCADD